MITRCVCTGILTILIVFGARAVPAQAHNINWQRSLTGQPMHLLSGCGGSYVVRSGDTLNAIARRCGVTVAGLKRANGLRSNRIWAGQVLSIPGATVSTTPKRTAPVPAATPPPPKNADLPTPTPAIESTVSPW